MIADAFRAECMKLLANRSALLWGFAAVPAIVLLTGAAFDAFVWATAPMARGVPRAPLLTDMAQALGAAGNPIWHVFYIAAAATLFAGEYRWESWRLLTPRAPRPALMLGKAGAFAAFAAASLIAIAVAGLAAAVFSALLNQAAQQSHPDPAGGWLALLLMYVAGLLQLLGVAALVALVSVVTRSLLGAVLLVFLLGIGQALFVGMFGAQVAGDPRFVLALPNLAAGTARGFAAHVAGDPDAPSQMAALAFASLLLWIAAPLAAAIALFQRQDLSQE